MAFGVSPPIRFRRPSNGECSPLEEAEIMGVRDRQPISLSQRLHNLVPDLLDEIMLIADAQTHEVLWLNKQGSRQYPEWPSQKCYHLFEQRQLPCPACPINGLTEDTPYVREVFNNETNSYMRCTTRIFRYEGHKYIFVTLQNIDSVKRREQQKERELLQQRVVNAAFADSMALLSQSDGDFVATVESILEKLGTTYNAKRAQLFEIYTNPAGKALGDCTFEWTMENVPGNRSKLQGIPVDIIDPWLTFFSENNTMFVEKVSDISDAEDNGGKLRHLLEELGVESMILQPFHCDDKIAGFVALDTPRRYQRETGVAQTLAMAIAQEKYRRQQISELTNLGTIDQLSGLQNRNRFNQVREHLIEHLPRTLGIAYVDLNNLKKINDEEGHEQGDAYIRAMSECFVRYFRHAETFRVGGDEFIIVASNMGHDLFMRRIQAMQDDANSLYAHALALGHVWTDDPCDLDGLIAKADALMYEHKRTVKAKLGQSIR